MPRKRSRIRNLAELAAVRLLFGLIGVFPLRTSMRIGRRVGVFLGRRLRRLRRTAGRNLEIAFPGISEAEKNRLTDGTFESLGRHLGLAAHLRSCTLEDVRGIVDIEGAENFYAAESEGRGILLFTGHFGSWEIFNLLPAAFGYKLHILVRRIDNPLVEKFVDAFRTRFGNETLDKMRSARRMYRVLEEGKYLGILADLNAQHREGIFVDFFGVPACTTTSMAKLALATDAILMPAFAVWNEERGRYVVHLEPPVQYERSGDHDRDIRRVTELVTRSVEKYVRAYPEQWLWIHKRWNTRPEGERGLY
jgi:KDO2-lipid IV(A) lauroyltransferase